MSKVEDQIIELGQDFWAWRSRQQPRSHDDIPRIERPEGWVPQWSADDVRNYREALSVFEARLAELHVGDTTDFKVDVEYWIDHSLLGAAMARVHWELDILRQWQTQPRFYVDQTIGTVFDVLVRRDLDEKQMETVLLLLNSFSQTLSDGKANLKGHAVREFAEVAVHELTEIEEQMSAMSAALTEDLVGAIKTDLLDKVEAAAKTASAELVSFREWIREQLPDLTPMVPVGKEVFRWFLTNVAFLPFTSDELLAIGNLEMDRATFLETMSKNKHRSVPQAPLPGSAIAQSENEMALEEQVRAFYEREGILTQPATLGHYLNAPLPAYLKAIRWLGVTDDLTGPSRLHENGVSYVPTPSPAMPYFYAANARDPRAGIVHEGAHYQQLALSWAHPREIRRHYYDSGSNEGIGFYNEELMLAAGLFDDARHSQSLIYNFMKLRALRVVIDVSLAIGALDIDSATRFLVEKVPMDEQTAREEATFFASCPGQGLTYQIGKTQIITLLADLMRANPSAFNLRTFHDSLWLNGNVPIALQRLSLLHDSSDLERVSKLLD